MNICSSNVPRIVLIFIAFFCFSSAQSQCAGTDSETTICNKETDPSLQNFDLFSVLSNATQGGTWIAQNNSDSSALNENTGIVNLWQVNRSGALMFTYANPSCDTSNATVTVNLGGYPGENSQAFGDNNACQNNSNVNLFSFLDIPDGIRGPDGNGVWLSNDTTLSSKLSDEFFNFVDLPTGTYSFTYLVPAVDTCPAREAIIDVELRKAPNSGVVTNLSLCETDDMSVFTTLNLFSRLDGSQDADGVWTDNSTPQTGEISSGTDVEINVQNIYDNFGAGSYTFSYEVAPDHPICEPAVTEFVLCIEEQLVLEATLSLECTGAVTLNYDSTVLANGNYNLDYTVAGVSLGSFDRSTGSIPFLNGTAQFNVLAGLQIQESENITVEITDISGGGTCERIRLCIPVINVPVENFDLYIDPTITASSTTGCALDDVLITYANIIDENFQPLQGITDVNYTINDIVFTDEVNFENGNAISTLPVERFNEGTNRLVFFNTNTFIHCQDIEVRSILNLIPVPENPVFEIISDERCATTNLEFNFNSPQDEFISYSSVTFDIYALGTEPEQFASRDANASLSNNTEGNGIDINISDRNDVSNLSDGDYVFVIRSVQNDNALYRGLSTEEVESYAAQNINIGLALVNRTHIFDVRLPFRIGAEKSATLNKSTFQICVQDQEVTLADLQLSAGEGVNIAIVNADGAELPSTFEITKDEVFTAIFTNASTACDLGTEEVTVTLVNQASAPVLEPNTFCELQASTVADLNTSSQNITWFNAPTAGTAYNSTDEIVPDNEYWGELTLIGGCFSANRTLAEINFINQAAPPAVQNNTFCNATTPVINDLVVNGSENATLTWYTSQTGPAFEDTALPLNIASEYWVTQTIVAGCESERVQVTFSLVDNARNPVPLPNVFCNANSNTTTLTDLNYQEASIETAGSLSYFSDPEATMPIASSVALNTLSSPVYVQQIVADSCFSEVVEVSFTFSDVAEAPILEEIELCAEDNPTVQNLLDALQQQVESTLVLYEDETTNTIIDTTILLADLTIQPFASQTILDGCESTERTPVVVTLVRPELQLSDFDQVLCSADTPTLNDVYQGSLNVLWFAEDGTSLSGTELIAQDTPYFAQLETQGCFTAQTRIELKLLEAQAPQVATTEVSLCGIAEKTISELLLIDGAPRFTIPENHNLVWYDSNDVNTRAIINEDTLLEHNSSYFAVFQVEGQGVICESNAVEIIVDLTNCDEDQLIIPDAFSPNNDTVNDVFELQNIEFIFPNYEIEIYNRYGRLVFKGDLETGFWDGKANRSGVVSANEVLPTGVYFYVINFNHSNKAPRQGQVYLKR